MWKHASPHSSAPPVLIAYSVSHALYIQVAELASLAQLLPPCSPTVRNPAPDSSLKSCFSPIASASLLLAACVRFSCCSQARLRPVAPRLPPPPAAAPDCARFSCCSPDCVRFGCCSPIAYWIPAHARRPGPMFSNILRGVRGSVNKLKYEGRASL